MKIKIILEVTITSTMITIDRNVNNGTRSQLAICLDGKIRTLDC